MYQTDKSPLLEQYGATERHFTEAALYPGWSLARVTAQYQGVYRVIADTYEGLAEVSGKFRFETKKPSGYPAVGDFVMVSGSGDGHALIHQLLRRKSCFERRAAGEENDSQAVAANIDFVFLCMAFGNNYNLRRLERYLSVAWGSGAVPVVVLTKSDLCGEAAALSAGASTAAPGADVIVTSSLDDSVQQLKRYLNPGITASFIGSSGAGKSTLINCLAGKEVFAVSETRRDGKGRHTTTRRELLLLPGGGIVIDTPGMRELGVESADLSKAFTDIDELAGQCRFRDCSHVNEPGCAVLRAVASGRLDEGRLENYRKLEKEAKYDGLSAKQIETAKIDSMFGGKAAMKQAITYVKAKNQR